jgi:hypothetical protein
MSFWKGNFSRYRNFATEPIEQDVVGTVESNGEINFTLKRAGDLVYNIMMAVRMKRGPSSPSDPTPYYSVEQLFDSIELYIGGQKVFEFTHEWFRMQWELFYDYSQEQAYNAMARWGVEPEGYLRTFYLPIPVWFNSYSPGSAIPLIALQYHDVQFKIKLADLNNIPGIDPTYTPGVFAYADYVFLDSPERIWFASNPHEYVVYQIQTNRFPITIDERERDYKFQLTFNHPTKALIWACTPGSTSHGQYTSLRGEQDFETLGPIQFARLTLNGVDRMAARRGSYFSRGNPWTTFSGGYCSAGIYAMGFGAYTDRDEPTGTCNFSRIDTAILQVRTKAAVITDATVGSNTVTIEESMTTVGANVLNTMYVWGPNYNVLRIMNGMGGMAFAN